MIKRGVSSKTHTKAQLNAYANQHNPNNPAYKSEIANKKKMKKQKNKYDELLWAPDAGMGWCDD